MGDVAGTEREAPAASRRLWLPPERPGSPRSRPPRVVLVPGVLGTVLTDSSLTAEQARRKCETNLGTIGQLLRGSPLYPCDKRPETLWGDVGSLHWLFDPEAWGCRMKVGNGMDVPGSVLAPSLIDVDVRLRRGRLTFQPYASFLRALRAAGADVLVSPTTGGCPSGTTLNCCSGRSLPGGSAVRRIGTSRPCRRPTG